MTYAIGTYNNTINSTTGFKPFKVVFGHTDSNTAFNGDVERCYTQQLLREMQNALNTYTQIHIR